MDSLRIDKKLKCSVEAVISLEQLVLECLSVNSELVELFSLMKQLNKKYHNQNSVYFNKW